MSPYTERMEKSFFELLEVNDNGDEAVAAIQAGYPVNRHLGNGSTPLVVAATFGQQRVVDTLIAFKANVNLATNDVARQMPLHAAAQWGWTDICKSLIDAGASIRSVDGVKATPLHSAAALGFVEICKLLLERGADASAKNKFKRATPLQVAVANGAQGIGEYEIGSFEREMASEGFSFPPRAKQDYVATINLLLRQGLSRGEISKAAKLARIYGSDEIVSILTFHGTR